MKFIRVLSRTERLDMVLHWRESCRRPNNGVACGGEGAMTYLLFHVDVFVQISAIKGPIHDQSCCATLRVVQHDWPCMVLIDLIVNEQTCVAQNNFAQHDWSCMGRITVCLRVDIRAPRPQAVVNPTSFILMLKTMSDNASFWNFSVWNTWHWKREESRAKWRTTRM
jgi:hypothetical protein